MTEALRVLVVEDLESDAALMIRHLEKAGRAVSWRRVEREEELREVLAAETWDIVLSDYQLPGFDAPRALEVVRAAEGDLPFIVVSGTIGDETAVALMKAGAQDYLRKENLTRLAPAVEREIAEARERRNRRAAERALRESEERFRIALKGSSTTVFNQDTELRYVWIHNLHPSFAMTEFLGQKDAELLPAEDATKLTAIKSRVLETGEPAREEVRTTIGGEAHYHLLTVEPWRDETGRIIGIAGAATDISETKRNEITMREQLDELRRWQELTLGRETRILELKNEVNQLLEKAGLSPRYPSAVAESGSREE
ncbi:MAG: PAS domain-containing protein [Thermoanaerobaculia bacterium]